MIKNIFILFSLFYISCSEEVSVISPTLFESIELRAKSYQKEASVGIDSICCLEISFKEHFELFRGKRIRVNDEVREVNFNPLFFREEMLISNLEIEFENEIRRNIFVPNIASCK